jgi:hypothetical protein
MDGKIHRHQQTECIGLYKDTQVYSQHGRKRIFEDILIGS